MKNLITIFATLLISLVSLNTFANPTNEFNKIAEVTSEEVSYSIYAVKDKEKIKFSFNKANDSKITLKIYSSDFSLQYVDVVKKGDAGSISYNLEQLGSGTYHVKIITDEFSKTHTFSVGEKAYENNFMPYIGTNQKEQKVRIAFENAFAPVVIKLYDTEGVVYHDEIVSNETKAHKVLNLSELDAGDYTVTVSSAGKARTETITITE